MEEAEAMAWYGEELYATQEELQHEKEENAYLRSLLKQMEINDVPAATDDDANDEFDELKSGKSNDSNVITLRCELKQAEDKIRQLELRLLDAEETICHLQAEKREALRDIERLQRHSPHNVKDTEERDQQAAQAHQLTALTARLTALQQQLSDVQKQMALEQEEHMAVIREQEQEVQQWKRAYQELQDQIKIAKETREEEQEAMRPNNQVEHTMYDWHEELVRHPTPHFDLDSPEVHYLLHAWTTNMKKIQYLRVWFAHIVHETKSLPREFPLGMELPRLLPEIRDGFLTLIVPLLRRQTLREIQVHTRHSGDPLYTDLRIRVLPRNGALC